jgi:hypothetical protein
VNVFMIFLLCAPLCGAITFITLKCLKGKAITQ